LSQYGSEQQVKQSVRVGGGAPGAGVNIPRQCSKPLGRLGIARMELASFGDRPVPRDITNVANSSGRYRTFSCLT
jgi:hypothetical protein